MDSTGVRLGRMRLAVMLSTLAILGGLIAGLTWLLREQLRAEVLRREAEAIHAVALMQLGRESPLAEFGAEFAIDDMFAAVLESAALRGVLAVQLFDAAGQLREAKPIAPDDAAATRWWGAKLPDAEARFVADGSLEAVSPILALETRGFGRLPLLEVVVPLRQPGAATGLGVARYWIDGEPVAGEFARMDRGLAVQAGAAFAGGAALLTLVLVWAFARLAEASRRLEAQRADLARANEELDFAAKTGALGAISAHLIHGLNNPLAGLEGFVAETAVGPAEAVSGEACRAAVETTRRLRALVNEIATVLRDEADGRADHAVPAAELVEATRQRAASDAEAAGIALQVIAEPAVRIDARTANLAGLVLANLVANAIEAAPPGASVTIEVRRAEAGVAFCVRDTGPGLPAAVRAGLFRPVRSAKRGGGGVGLAISHRLARHAGGTLELVRSDAHGTEFLLTVSVFTGAQSDRQLAGAAGKAEPGLAP
ncbi:MAG: HAMP domain-containing sensor histidine kinase [Opitutaceae bacterium]|nr:HAMP domain-containing sensor histidine kinase [Opitutaceae bacterium]